ncbi:kinase-like domain-containing protein [Mycena rosella]|uniref:Kinase-like domain-containing protein n=1 Tax=Mycena rosella TaxID=1033263 RepID=A0AAD7GAB8_MYCRO|nr:kinase-like domain-containing protein [Mycena rosella]
MLDFTAYLVSQLSLQPADFKVGILTGGLTNVTVRATFARPTSLFKSLPFHSVVLKHAPPYLASDPTQPMSVNRQHIEANALRYLANEPEIQTLFAQFTDLKIPHLIHHDTTSNVLWITDLGVSQTLSKFLSTSPPPADGTIREIAVTLGNFFAQFWKITAYPTPETIIAFSRPDDQDDPVYYLASTALRVMLQRGVPDAEILGARIRATMQVKDKLEPCPGMVDFWPGSILIGFDGSRGLVDWEYFGISTSGAEIGMLVAHLDLIILYGSSTQESCEAIRSFISVFLDSAYDTHVPPVSSYFKRQAMIAYGREMITAVEFFAEELDEEAQRRVLDAGICSLRAAAESEEEMGTKLVNATAIREVWDGISR